MGNEREFLLRHTGNLGQVAGVRRFIYADGMARGIPAVEVKTGSGLRFTVLDGRCMDLYEMEYKGINLAFYYKNGLTAPERITHTEGEFMRQGSGGMLYTSGLMNSGPPNSEDGWFHPLHGRISSTGAEQAYATADFDENGDYCIALGGRMRESQLFRHHLILNRRIETKAYSKAVRIMDTIENFDAKPAHFSLLYHINLGFPFLQDGVRIVLPEKTVTEARTELSKQGFDQRFAITAPNDDFVEHLFYYDIPADNDGYCHALIVNDKLELAVYERFPKETLPYFVEWKSMRSGDYALGVMPSSTKLRGRSEELANGGMNKVDGFGKYHTEVELTILDGRDEITRVEKMIREI